MRRLRARHPITVSIVPGALRPQQRLTGGCVRGAKNALFPHDQQFFAFELKFDQITRAKLDVVTDLDAHRADFTRLSAVFEVSHAPVRALKAGFAPNSPAVTDRDDQSLLQRDAYNRQSGVLVLEPRYYDAIAQWFDARAECQEPANTFAILCNSSTALHMVASTSDSFMMRIAAPFNTDSIPAVATNVM